MAVTTGSGGLAAMAAGPGLSAALHPLDLGAIPDDELLAVLVAQHRQLSHEQARMAAVLAEIGRCPALADPGQVSRSDRYEPDAPAETRAALRWTRQAADTEHLLAEAVVHGMPLLYAAWLTGAVDRPRVQLFAQYLFGLPTEQVQRICVHAVPQAPNLTTGQLAALLRRMVIAVDPEAAARWYRRGVAERNVIAYPAEDGTITVAARGLPADQAEAACARIERLAAAVQRAGHPGRIGQIRCDLFLGLLDGRFHQLSVEDVIAAMLVDAAAGGQVVAGHGTDGDSGGAAVGPVGCCGNGRRGSASGSGAATERGRGSVTPSDAPVPDRSTRVTRSTLPQPRSAPDERVGIEIRVGLSTVLGRDEHPAEIPGLTLLVAPEARLRVLLQGRSEWRFAVTGSDGVLLTEGLTRRRPAGTRRDGPPGGVVELHVPVDLLAELAADPAGCGEWAGVVADIAAQHADRAQHLVDLDRRPGDRFPTAGLRRHTEIRDRTCTFAGVCRRPAHRSDIDHCVDHAAGGRTVRHNLGPLCDQDHALKHRAGWTVEQTTAGRFVWRSPLGGRYTARGEILVPDLPEPAPRDPASISDTPWQIVDGPILARPPPTVDGPRSPPARVWDDTEPPF